MHYIVVNDSLIIKFVNLKTYFRNILLTNYIYSQTFTTIELKIKF